MENLCKCESECVKRSAYLRNSWQKDWRCDEELDLLNATENICDSGHRSASYVITRIDRDSTGLKQSIEANQAPSMLSNICVCT